MWPALTTTNVNAGLVATQDITPTSPPLVMDALHVRQEHTPQVALRLAAWTWNAHRDSKLARQQGPRQLPMAALHVRLGSSRGV